jgi:hypothetical protein
MLSERVAKIGDVISLATLAYEAALRSLDKQEKVLDELRARTGLLLAASSLAASFLGRPAIERSTPVLVILAFVAFAVSLVASLYILLPKRELLFSLVGAKVYEQMYEFRGDMAEVHRRLAYDLDRFWEANDRKLQKLFLSFRIAVSALAVEIAFLLAAATDTLY